MHLIERVGAVPAAVLLIAWAELRLLRPALTVRAWSRAIGARLGVTADELREATRSPNPTEGAAGLPAAPEGPRRG